MGGESLRIRRDTVWNNLSTQGRVILVPTSYSQWENVRERGPGEAGVVYIKENLGEINNLLN